MKRLIVGVVAGLAAVMGVVSPAAAEQPPPTDIGVVAHDERACAAQPQPAAHRSPSCRPEGFGLQSNHNETLVRDAD